MSSRVEVGGDLRHRRPKGASMDADLDLLLIAVYLTAGDLLPEKLPAQPGYFKRRRRLVESGILRAPRPILNVAEVNRRASHSASVRAASPTTANSARKRSSAEPNTLFGSAWTKRFAALMISSATRATGSSCGIRRLATLGA